MDNLSSDIIQSWLDFLILNTLSRESMYGSDIQQRIEQKTCRLFEVSRASILKALQRLESAGWLEIEWRQTGDLKLEKLYSVSRAGKEQFEAEWKGPKSALAQFVREGKWLAFHSQKAQPDSWN